MQTAVSIRVKTMERILEELVKHDVFNLVLRFEDADSKGREELDAECRRLIKDLPDSRKKEYWQMYCRHTEDYR